MTAIGYKFAIERRDHGLYTDEEDYERILERIELVFVVVDK